MKVVSLTTQVGIDNLSYLPDDIFEINDQETYDYKIRVGLVKDFENAKTEEEIEAVKASRGRKREKVEIANEAEKVVQ